jgi:2-methylcitrate dehydratase PrpD
MSLLQGLAERIHAFDAAQVTGPALHLARTALIDTIAVMLAGSAEPCTTNLLRTPGIAEAPGACTLVGTPRKTSALDAAFVNGTASHALDYDDFSQPMGGHQSVPLVAPLLAIAEEKHFSGAALLTSYVIGIETEIRLARAVNFHHYDKGWHPTATIGIFGTTAAVGHLLRLEPGRLTTALAIAASFASGLKANFGTMVKPLHVGQTARNGLLAVLLAESGYDANPTTLEHKQGFLNAFNGPGTYDSNLLLSDWANPLEITSPTMGLKQFPCCGSTHPAIAMMLLLRQEEGITAEDVAEVKIMPHRRRLPHTDNPDPQTPLAAKFSVQYVVARALLDGTVRLAHFEGTAHLDPAIRRIMVRTTTLPHPDMADDAAEQFGAEIQVTLHSGKTLSRRIDGLIGRGGDNPLSSEELWEKFQDCGRRALPKQDLLPLFERLESFEKIADVGDITRLLTRRALPTAAAPRPTATSANTLLETSWIP